MDVHNDDERLTKGRTGKTVVSIARQRWRDNLIELLTAGVGINPTSLDVRHATSIRQQPHRALLVVVDQ